EARYKPLTFSLLKRQAACLKPYRWLYAGGTMLGAGHVLLEMRGPQFMRNIIDFVTAYTTGWKTQAADTWLVHTVRDAVAALGFGSVMEQNDTAAIAVVVGIILIWALVVAVSLALLRSMVLTFTRAGENVQFDIRRRVFAHLQRLSMNYYDKTKLGRIISRCTSDINSLREVNVGEIGRAHV